MRDDNSLMHKKYKYIKKVPAPGGGYYYVYPKDSINASTINYKDNRFRYTTKSIPQLRSDAKEGVDYRVSERSAHTDALFGRSYEQELVTGIDDKGKATEITTLRTKTYGQLDRLGWKMETKISDAFEKSKKQINSGMKAVSNWFKKIF